jgi:hypothetical protein
MGPQTRKSANAPRTHAPSAKVRANTQKISKSAPKRVKSKRFINPNTISKESTPIPSEFSPPPIEQLDDVSDMKYNVAMSCMLGPTSIFSDTKKNKLSQFDFHDFSVNMIKKLAKASNNAKYTVEWDSATAVISADHVSKANWTHVRVEEDSNWKEIEEWIEEWMRKKRDNITVRLTVLYQKVLRDDLESSSNENVPAKGSKVR